MKKTAHILKTMLFITVFGSLLSCKESAVAPNSTTYPGEILAGTWVAESPNAISGPTGEAEAQFVDFEITLLVNATGVSYTTKSSGNKAVFPEQGNLEGIDENDDFTQSAEVTQLPDSVPMTVTLTEDGKTLTLAFSIDSENSFVGSNGSRTAGLVGGYVFVLDKQ